MIYLMRLVCFDLRDFWSGQHQRVAAPPDLCGDGERAQQKKIAIYDASCNH